MIQDEVHPKDTQGLPKSLDSASETSFAKKLDCADTIKL
jgi:hypothetical protein